MSVSDVGLDADNPIRITDGLSGHGSAYSFFADRESCAIIDVDGEAYLKLVQFTVSFDDGYGSEEMEAVSVDCGSDYELPECGFSIAQEPGVTFEGWRVPGEEDPLQPGEEIEINGDITVTAIWSNNWNTLQGMIDDEANSTIELEWDCVAASINTALEIPEGRTLTIDLKGHTIDRNLGGNVITNDGTLTITDSVGSGVITGGRNSGNGGGIVNNGTLTISGGNITNNETEGQGGGVWSVGNLEITGGYITGNIAQKTGGGIYVSGSAGLSISGSVQVADNLCGDAASNLTLAGNTAIHIEGDVPETSLIGVSVADVTVTADTPFTVTDGLPGRGSADSFFADAESFLIGENGDGELILGVPATVSFDDGYGSDGMDAVSVVCGGIYSLPECGFVPPAGRLFKEWSVTIGNADPVTGVPADDITVTADTVVTAVWEIIPEFTPDFVIPAGTVTIEEHAFEGIAATAVIIREDCTLIGDYAFKDCANLALISIPAECELGENVFEGCTEVLVYSAAGSPADDYCQNHENCRFVETAQE